MIMKKTVLALLALGLFLAATDIHAGDPWLEAFSRLSKVERFAFGKIGVAAVTSQGEKDLRVLLAGECPIVTLKALYGTGTLEAKCYALVALQKLSRKDFEALSKELESLDAEVTTVSACEILRIPVRRLITDIKKGSYAEYLEQKHTRQILQ